MNQPWLDIFEYRDFWDVPRIFLVESKGKLMLFDCPFEEDLDDYPDQYAVYELGNDTHESLPKDWTLLARRATKFMGYVPVISVRFDPTKRKQVQLNDSSRIFGS